MNALGLQYKKTSHFFHLFMTIITGGFWLTIWLVCWALNSNHNSRINAMMLHYDRQPQTIIIERYKSE